MTSYNNSNHHSSVLIDFQGNIQSLIEYQKNKNKVADSSANVRDAGESNA